MACDAAGMSNVYIDCADTAETRGVQLSTQ